MSEEPSESEIMEMMKDPLKSNIIKDGIIYSAISIVMGFAIKKLTDISEEMD